MIHRIFLQRLTVPKVCQVSQPHMANTYVCASSLSCYKCKNNSDDHGACYKYKKSTNKISKHMNELCIHKKIKILRTSHWLHCHGIGQYSKTTQKAIVLNLVLNPNPNTFYPKPSPKDKPLPLPMPIPIPYSHLCSLLIDICLPCCLHSAAQRIIQRRRRYVR